jgi:cytochrome P450
MLNGRDAIRWPGFRPLGALPDIQVNPLETFMRARFELGELVNLRMPHAHIMAMANPRIVEHILLTQVAKFTKDTRGYDQMRRVLGNGLLTSQGSFWLRQRRLAQPAFHRDRLARWGEVMVRSTREMISGWQPRLINGAPFDAMKEMMKLTMRIVGETLLSADVMQESASVTHALTNGLEVIQHMLTHPFSLPQWVPTRPNREFSTATKALNDVVFGIISERRRGTTKNDDLLSMLMNAVDLDTGERMSDEQLRDEVMTIFLAGHETTAVLLSWALYVLSKHPGIERRVRAELTQVLGAREVTTDDVPKLPYLARVIKEVLRLYPPAWILGRRVTEDMVIDGWNLPARSVVMFSSYVLHRLPETFPNPEGFDPDRWLEEEHLPKGAYIPFSVGGRKCIGDSFANLEAVLILATLLPKVQLSLVPGQNIVPEPMITIRPRGGVQMVASAVKGGAA